MLSPLIFTTNQRGRLYHILQMRTPGEKKLVVPQDYTANKQHNYALNSGLYDSKAHLLPTISRFPLLCYVT